MDTRTGQSGREFDCRDCETPVERNADSGGIESRYHTTMSRWVVQFYPRVFWTCVSLLDGITSRPVISPVVVLIRGLIFGLHPSRVRSE